MVLGHFHVTSKWYISCVAVEYFGSMDVYFAHKYSQQFASSADSQSVCVYACVRLCDQSFFFFKFVTCPRRY